jgi:hypothetical protein
MHIEVLELLPWNCGTGFVAGSATGWLELLLDLFFDGETDRHTVKHTIIYLRQSYQAYKIFCQPSILSEPWTSKPLSSKCWLTFMYSFGSEEKKMNKKLCCTVPGKNSTCLLIGSSSHHQLEGLHNLFIYLGSIAGFV